MIRFNPRWPLSFAKAPRLSRSMLVAILCVAVALLSYVTLVAYESTEHTPFWH